MKTYVEYRLMKQGDETANWEAVREIKAESRRQVMKLLGEEDKKGEAVNVQRKVRTKE
jgi:hypothetical protein